MMEKNSPTKQPEVAIVIPVYNRKADLIRLLQSIFKQDYKNFAVFVVDNGSTDRVGEVSSIHPEINILTNDKNYGATVGFNKGLVHTASSGLYKYIWMLDSDLVVDEDCLSTLVKVSEADESIGIAGPKILNINNRNLIVEIGANIDMKTAQVFPLYCNEPDIETKELLEVDYVGSGISLVRVDAFKKVGLMDERYFFLWDDMDYGLAMNRSGYKVVAVPNAAVYHPPFTEKRGVGINAYYGVRSMLLTVSKYQSSFSRVCSIYNVLRRVLKICSFRFLSGYPGIAKLNINAIWDFCINKWGENTKLSNIVNEGYTQKQKAESIGVVDIKSVLILPSGTYKTVDEIIELLTSNNEEIHLSMVVQGYRKKIFEDLPIDKFILYDDRKGNLIFTHLTVFIKLLFMKFDIAVNPDTQSGSPFAYALKRVYGWDSSSRAIFKSSENIFGIWKLPVSILFGEILALILLPFIYLASLKYEIK